MYFDWIKTHHGIGNDKKTCTKLFFPNPIGKKNKITKFNAGEKFPVPVGEDWDTHKAEYELKNGAMHALLRSIRR